MEALFLAYFTGGRDLSKRQTLIDVVAEAGLDRRQAEALLEGSDGLEAIREAEGQARQLHVDGVPFFIINDKFGLSGAQQPEAFLDVFRREADHSRS